MSERYCVVPPHILRRIQENGTPEERDLADATLRLDETARVSRIQAGTVRSAPAVEGTAGVTAKRNIYDAGHGTGLPGTLVRAEGAPDSGDVTVNEAYDGLGATLALYGDIYRRNSLDGAGQDLTGTVHYGNKYNNAQWNGTQMLFGDGDGTIFNRFTIAIDIIGHELTHGVTQHTAGLNYYGQSGALNESVSDVFGSLVKQYHAAPRETADQADWLIGKGIFTAAIKGVAIRSMKDPGTAYDDPKLGKDPQPATMDDYQDTFEDNGGVHINSGIPNRAFYLAAVGIGGYAWEKAGQVWYDTLIDPKLSASATFVQFAALTVANAARFGSDVAGAVQDAWQQVGVRPAKLLDELRA
jgi:Zn-dependent metalloprotease